MKKPSRAASVLFAAVLAGALPAAPQQQVPFGPIISEQAQASFDLLGAGARAAAMGGAFTAVADDATAASFNPAGLAQLLVPEASLVVDYRRLEDRFVDFTSFDQVPPLPLTDSATTFGRTDLSFLSLTLPARWLGRRWAFQLSSQKLVDFAYESDLDYFETDLAGVPLFELRQVNQETGGIGLLSFSTAVELTRRTLVGITVNHWDGDWRFTSFNSENPAGGVGESEQYSYRQSNALGGWNVDLGVLLRYKYLNVGARYRLPFDASYRIDASLDTNLDTPLAPLEQSSTDLRWPATLNLGVAVRPTGRWTLAFDWGRTDWADMNLLLPGAPEAERRTPVNFFDLAPRDSTAASEVSTLRAGSELIFLKGSTVIPLRAGWFREPQPAADPVTGDRRTTIGYTLGVGVKRGPWSVDLAVVHETSDTRISRVLEPDEIVSGELVAASQGRRERQETSVLLSLIAQVPKGSKLARLLYKLFVGPLPEDGLEDVE